jgi:acyl-CoA synthetase (AMP-forming)/AMP-acid ligase II
MELPRFVHVRQQYPTRPRLDLEQVIAHEMSKIRDRVQPGNRIAIAVGSRGITHFATIVREVANALLEIGAKPFLIPAMGSHGGATPKGQLEVLESYGITEAAIGVPIVSSMEVDKTGQTTDGIAAYCSRDALAADGIVLVNRIKPHTDFFGTLGSGLMKMSVIGLGKHVGASAMHLGAMRFGYEKVIKALATINIQNTPFLGGLAILEDPMHETAKLEFVPREVLEVREPQLLKEAREMMPQLPFEEIDLLIVDELGKNISGAGMDPNVINRSIHGYSSLPARGDHSAPFIRRIFVRGLTAETQGNAIGIGLADATTHKLIKEMDQKKTDINARTSLTILSCKIPMSFSCDRDAIQAMLLSLPIDSPVQARIVRIRDTLSLADMQISETAYRDVQSREDILLRSSPAPLDFDLHGNLSSKLFQTD